MKVTSQGRTFCQMKGSSVLWGAIDKSSLSRIVLVEDIASDFVCDEGNGRVNPKDFCGCNLGRLIAEAIKNCHSA